MNAIRKAFWIGSMLALSTGPAFAGINVSSPGNGAVVSSPFTLSASATNCSSRAVIVMGYSFDSSPSTSLFFTSSLHRLLNASVGGHTLHVKAWGRRGAACVTDVSIQVQPNTLLTPITPPVWAVSVSNIQSLSNWFGANDTEASGSSMGDTSMVSSPSLYGNARQFDISFLDSGSERFYATFGDDSTSTNFLYDTWVYLDNSSPQIANLEFDVDQVLANGQTVIFGVQCDGWSNTWDYTANTGTPTNWAVAWVHTPQSCNPRTWSINTWHHVQIAYSRDDSGNVTYKTISLDGGTVYINATVNSAFALGWDPVLLTNFQIDGYGSSGTATVYLDSLNVQRW